MVSQIGMLSVVEAPDILYNQVKREDNEKIDNILYNQLRKRIMMLIVDKSEDGEKISNSENSEQIMIFQTSNDTITMEGASALLKCEARYE